MLGEFMNCLKKKAIAFIEFMYKYLISPVIDEYNYIKMRWCYRISIMNSCKTIEYIINHQCSVSRFGDGEFGLMLGEWECNFQKSNFALKKKLLDILLTDDDKVLVCIPKYYRHVFGAKKTSRKIWKSMCFNSDRQQKVVSLLKQNRKKDFVIGDSFISRPYIDMKTNKLAKKVFPLLKSLWLNRDVIIIEGEYTRLGVGNDLFDDVKSLKRIIAPAENAFDFYDDIVKCTSDNYSNELVLIALGPTATVMAYDLAKIDIWAIDIGHIDIEFEWFLQGAKDKVAIKGKYTNEAKNGNIVDDVVDKVYESQIIARIGC